MTVDEYLAGDPGTPPHHPAPAADHAAGDPARCDGAMSYGMPAFKVGGRSVAGYAYFKNHCSYFPHSGSVLPGLADQLGGYEWSKGTLRFPIDKPLPKSLVRRLVDARLGL